MPHPKSFSINIPETMKKHNVSEEEATIIAFNEVFSKSVEESMDEKFLDKEGAPNAKYRKMIEDAGGVIL